MTPHLDRAQLSRFEPQHESQLPQHITRTHAYGNFFNASHK
jgi:hypothetical protein